MIWIFLGFVVTSFIMLNNRNNDYVGKWANSLFTFLVSSGVAFFLSILMSVILIGAFNGKDDLTISHDKTYTLQALSYDSTGHPVYVKEILSSSSFEYQIKYNNHVHTFINARLIENDEQVIETYDVHFKNPWTLFWTYNLIPEKIIIKYPKGTLETFFNKIQ